MAKNQSVSVIIVTLNAEKTINELLCVLERQTVAPIEILVVDSASDDNTAALVKTHSGAKLIEIDRSQFDHGGTRDMALRQSVGDIICFFTQDAIPVDDHCLENLASAFSDEKIACVCGRQMSPPDARPEEIFTRAYNYPQTSFVRSKADRDRMGIKAFFLSDSCSAYRRTAYEDVGGFEAPILTNEDMLIAAKFLDADWQIAYCAEATVWHGHEYSLSQDYRRSFDIGVFLKMHEVAFQQVNAESEGIKYVAHVCCKLLKRFRLWSAGRFLLHCSARFLGSRKGLGYQRLSREQILRYTGHPGFWKVE